MIDFKDEEIIVCKKAIDLYGEALQKIVAVEEMGELIQAISKSLRGDDHNVEEEIADVMIMITQLMMMYDLKKVMEIREAKLKRLERVVL